MNNGQWKMGEYQADKSLPPFSLIRTALKYGFPYKLSGEILCAEQMHYFSL